MGWKQKLFGSVLVLSLALPAIAPSYNLSGNAQTVNDYVTYNQDFSNITQTPDPVWDVDDAWQVNNAHVINGVLTNESNALYGLRYKYKTPASGIYTAEFDLQAAISPEQSPWNTSFVGLRQSNYNNGANEPDGLWLAFRGNQIGLRTAAWPQTSYVTSPYDFNDALRKVFIEDHVDENIIKIFIADNDGNKVLAAQISIDGQTVSLFSAAQLEAPQVTTELSYELSKSGYIQWWVHNIADVRYDNVTVTTADSSHSIDFPTDTVVKDDIWELNSGQIIDGALTNTTGGLYGLRFNKRVADTGKHQIEFDLQSATEDDSPWMTAYVGLRMKTYTSQASDTDGLWLAFKNNKIGIRTDAWPQTGYIEVPFSFSQSRRVFLEDDKDSNIVSIHVADDQGNKTFVGQVRIVGQTITLYSADDLQNPKVTSQAGYTIENSGFIGWWVHNIPNVVFDNVSVTMKEYTKPPYVPADPLQFRDVYSDTWVATDALARTAPTFSQAGSPKAKKIGMFYFLWHDAQSGEIYDHNKAYQEGGLDAVWNMIPQGPLGFAHYWAEPYFGYYRSDDRWVIRKHASMLVEAGIDFVFFDNSNNVMYKHIYSVILDEYEKMRSEGLATPQVAFFFGDRPDFGKQMMSQAWDEIYKDNYYNDLWFKVDGKPLVMGDLSQVSPNIRSQFTIRKSWAFNSWTGEGVGKWPWIAEYPQTPGKDPLTGELEQVTVAAGFHANGAGGRSMTGGQQPTDGLNGFEFQLQSTPLGLTYDEQWSRAYELDPEYVLLTGWNEWWAGRWDAGATGQIIANTYTVTPDDPIKKNYYVDSFNPEFSRDIEPMKGGFSDNYYYQTVEKIRQFKGARPIPAAFGQEKIKNKKDFEEWNAVGPEYRDTLGDTLHRDSLSFANKFHYTNTSGRNDIEYAKVSSDKKNWYFYVRTKDTLTAPEGTNWMNLLINSDQNGATGWEGYDYIINRSRNNGKVSIERSQNNSWTFETVDQAEFKVIGNELAITVPKSLLPLSATPGFDFKWADNSVADGDIMQFLDLGDAAPNGRFNYQYTTTSQQVVLSQALDSLLSSGAIALKVNTYEAYVGKNKRLIDEDDTKAVPVGINGTVYLPVRFIEKTLKKEFDKKAVKLLLKSIKKMEYVDVAVVAQILGKKVTVSPNGIIVFASQEQIDQAILDEISLKL